MNIPQIQPTLRYSSRHSPAPDEPSAKGATQRQKLLAFLISKRGEWIPSHEVAAVGGLQYGARLKEIRDAGDYMVESRVERVRTGRGSHVVHSWFKLLTDHEALAWRMANGVTVTKAEIEDSQREDGQAELFSSLPERHRDDG
jgi:hypothetical protein